jgi:hypothetical protein
MERNRAMNGKTAPDGSLEIRFVRGVALAFFGGIAGAVLFNDNGALAGMLIGGAVGAAFGGTTLEGKLSFTILGGVIRVLTGLFVAVIVNDLLDRK